MAFDHSLINDMNTFLAGGTSGQIPIADGVGYPTWTAFVPLPADPGDPPLGVSGTYMLKWNTTSNIPAWDYRWDVPSAGATNGALLRYTTAPAAALEWCGESITSTYMMYWNSDLEPTGTSKLTFDGTDFTLAVGSSLIDADFTSTYMLYADANKKITSTSKMTFDGTDFTLAAGSSIKGTDLTATQMLYATTGGEIVSTAKMTHDGTHFSLASGTFLKSAGVMVLIPLDYSAGALQLFDGRNARGNGAVDLQAINTGSAATEVASGELSFCAGARNTASGQLSSCIGYLCVASATYACAFNYSRATGQAATSFGYNSWATAEYSMSMGRDGLADMSGQFARGARANAARGDRQVSELCAWRNTTDATQTEVFLFGSTAGTGATDMPIPENTIWGFTIFMVARQTNDDFSTAAWEIKGTIARDTGGNVVLKNQSTTYTYQDDATWAFAVDAYTTGQRLRLRVTGAADNNISWLASLTLRQITG
jgi:hypothetical protein